MNVTQSITEGVPIFSKLSVYNDNGTEVSLEIDPRDLERMVPEFDAERSVYFTLYTTNNREGVQVDLFDGENLEKVGYDSSRPTVLITHGWMNTHLAPACKLVKEGL